jgi:hypothetical protein
MWVIGAALSVPLSGCDLLQDWLHGHVGGGGGWTDDGSSEDTDANGDTGQDTAGDSGVLDTGASEDTGDTGGDTATSDTGGGETGGGETGETDHQGGCTYTQGFWKTHGPVPVGNNDNEWPVTSLSLGTTNYTDLQLLSILNTPPQGNGLISLAHQLIAAKLNVANGADDTDIASTIAAADALVDGLVIPPVGSGSLSPSVTSGLTDALDDYNSGNTGPGHCED